MNLSKEGLTKIPMDLLGNICQNQNDSTRLLIAKLNPSCNALIKDLESQTPHEMLFKKNTLPTFSLATLIRRLLNSPDRL
jgi:hypothetical protein